MPPLVVKWSKCSVSIASARTTIDHKAYDAVISNMGFVILATSPWIATNRARSRSGRRFDYSLQLRSQADIDRKRLRWRVDHGPILITARRDFPAKDRN